MVGIFLEKLKEVIVISSQIFDPVFYKTQVLFY